MRLHHVVMVAAFGGLGMACFAQPDRSHLDALTIDQLKTAYIECDQQASRTLLTLAESAECSMVHEALKQRAFAGNFDAMLAWWTAHKRRSAKGQAPNAAPQPPR
jgi:hypothetical protein